MGTCLSTSFAVPALANTLFSTFVTNEFPFKCVLEALPLITTSFSWVLEVIILIFPSSPSGVISIYFVLNPTNDNLSFKPVVKSLDKLNSPLLLVITPVTNAESCRRAAFTNSMGFPFSSRTRPFISLPNADEEKANTIAMVNNKSFISLLI